MWKINIKDMIQIPEYLMTKHAIGIQAAMNYYVYSQPTGLDDSYYDYLENEARKDGIELRDYATQFIQGQRSMNASYITKVEKQQVPGNMCEALKNFQEKDHPEISFWIPKYDGSSLAAYYDPSRGKCVRVVTIGGTNLGSEGIDQTEKLGKYFPDLPGTGIIALQCECLVSLEHGLGEKSRQKANGLVCSSYTPLSFQEFKFGQGTQKEYLKYLEKFDLNFQEVKNEIDHFINIRCFRYYIDSSFPSNFKNLSYKEILQSLPVVYNSAGDIKFCGGYVFETPGEFVEKDIWTTPTGTFLVDGVVGYSKEGLCIKAYKYKSAGRGETTEVLGIKWNDQSKKGKDSWSANAIINPIQVRGTEIKKPTVGSIKKMIDSGLSKGARVTVILANSTIPQVSQVIQSGNGDFEWPTCECGYKIGPIDIYGALVKCGNPNCQKREIRMRNYLNRCSDFTSIDLNKLLILDRFDWTKKTDLSILLPELQKIIRENQGIEAFIDYLGSFLSTEAQKRNLNLVARPAYKTLLEYVRKNNSNGN